MSIVKNQVPISILPIANGAGGNPPAPTSADFVPVVVFDPGKIGGPGFRTARVSFAGLLLAPIVQGITRIHTAAGAVAVAANDAMISVEKTVGAATSVVFPLAATKTVPCVIKDGKGDADTNPISITFTGGETCDGLATVVIDTPFDELKFTPRPGGNYWLGK